MSLTSFLELKDVRARFSEEFSKPKFQLTKPILAPPLTKRYGLVGTAFDYLLRFCVKHLNPDAVAHNWVALNAIDRMETLRVAYCKGEIMSISNDQIKKAHNLAENAEMLYIKFLSSGIVDRKLIKSVLQLAQLDTYFRSGIIDEDFGGIYEEDVMDLSRLISCVEVERFRARQVCVLNPTFGEASVLVGGADADLLMDGRLIDIKTTSKLEMKREDFNQLIGYYALSRLGGVDGVTGENPIRELGIYSARYAEFLAFPVDGVIDETKMKPFLEWIEKRAGEAFDK